MSMLDPKTAGHEQIIESARTQGRSDDPENPYPFMCGVLEAWIYFLTTERDRLNKRLQENENGH